MSMIEHDMYDKHPSLELPPALDMDSSVEDMNDRQLLEMIWAYTMANDERLRKIEEVHQIVKSALDEFSNNPMLKMFTNRIGL